MSQAASEMLGANVHVRTETFPDEHPDAVRPPEPGEQSAMLSWDTARHEHARLRLCRATDDCLERWVAFEDSDPEVERGRTLGFLVAAVFLDESTASTPSTPPPPSMPAPLGVSVTPSAPVTPSPAPRLEPREPARAPRRFPRGELTAAVAASGPGDGTTLGANLGADYAASLRFRVGLSGELRFGELSQAQASSQIASLLARTSYVLVEPESSPWLGVSAAIGLYHLSASHFSSDDLKPDRQGRFLLGGTLGALGGINFNSTSALYLDLGAELLSGKTTIVVHQEPRATLPLVNPLARVGLRAAF
jgi:hypothetical protein